MFSLSLIHISLHGVSEAESSQRLKQLADYLEITDVLDKFPSKMSGGQRQRDKSGYHSDMEYSVSEKVN